MNGSVPVWPLALAALAAPPAHAQSAWKLSGSGSETTLTLEAQAFASLYIGYSKTARRPELVLKCHDRKPMVGVFIGKLNEDRAIIRFDREPAHTVGLRNRVKWAKLWMWSTVLDPDTMFFEKPVEIAAALLRHKKMLVRVTPARQPSLEVTFDLPRLEPQLAAFEQACDLEKPIPRPAGAAATSRPPASPARPAKPPAPGVVTFGGWKQSVTTSRIDDRHIVLLSLPQSKQSSSAAFASLVLRCRESETEAFLSFNAPLDGPLGYDLAVRASVDGGLEVKEWWLAPSTDKTAFFFKSAPPLLKRLLASKQLRLAYRPGKHPERHGWMPEGEAVFTLAGLDRASKAFLDACPTDLAKVKVKDGLAKLP